MHSWLNEMDGEEAFSVDQLSDILPNMEDNVDNWINHATWYDLECINHYDQQPAINCVGGNPALSPVPHMTVSSTIPTEVQTLPKMALAQETEATSTSDILNGLQTILKSNNLYDAVSTMSNDYRTAVSVSPSGIMNGIFIPSNLIQQNIVQKEYKGDPVTVTVSPPVSSEIKTFPQNEEELLEFLKSQGGKKFMAKALDISEEELMRLSSYADSVDSSCKPVDYHCVGCQCISRANKGNINTQESMLPLPAIDPRSPELMKATSPDSSTALSDHLSPSHFDNNLAASPEIPIIKREFIDDMDRNENHAIDCSPVMPGEKTRRHRGTYPKSLCLDVIEFVKQGFSARAAAKKFGIPKSTVHNWLHEDIATRPEKGHRKRAATQAINPTDAPRTKTKPDMNELLPTSHDLSSRSSCITYENAKDALANSFTRNRTSESFSSEELDPRVEVVLTLKASPTPGSSRETLSGSPCSEVSGSHGNTEAKMEGEDLSCDLDELLHIEDWIEQEEWYRQQYMKHYGSPYKCRKTYGSYSNMQRKAAIDFVQQGNTISTAARKFNIPKSTIHTWLTEEAGPCVLPSEVEQEILKRLEDAQKTNGSCCLKLGMVKRIAQDVAAAHVNNFRASYPWCRDFVKRHDIYLFDSKESIDRLCQEDENYGKPPSMVDFTSFLGLKPANETHSDPAYSQATGSL